MRLLTLQFQLPLHPARIPQFRGAIAQLVGLDEELFHQHANGWEETDPYHRDYPLVQYAVRRGRAALIGLNAGADAIRRKLLPVLGQELHFGGENHLLPGFRLAEQEVSLALMPEPVPFGLNGWMALNQENYTRWKEASSESARLDLLHRALTGHLRAFGERMQVADYKHIEARVLEIHNRKKIHWHGVELIRFQVLAQANIALPEGIGIGRAAAFGYGETLSEEQFRRMVLFSRSGGSEVL